MGFKTATTRKGLKDYTVGLAKLVDPADPSNFIDIVVTSVHLYTWRSIVHSDYLYVYEGYDRSSDLDEALEDIYGKMDDDQLMTVIYFRVVKEG